MAKRRRSRSPLRALMRWLLVLAALALFVYWGNTDIKTDAVTYTTQNCTRPWKTPRRM